LFAVVVDDLVKPGRNVRPAGSLGLDRVRIFFIKLELITSKKNSKV